MPLLPGLGAEIPPGYSTLSGIFGKLKIIVMRIIHGKTSGDPAGFGIGTISITLRLSNCAEIVLTTDPDKSTKIY